MEYISRVQPLVQGVGGRVQTPLPQNLDDHLNFFDEECEYRYVTACTARNWVRHPHFVLYNNLDQGIGPPNFENVVAPLVYLVTHCI